MPRFFVSFPLFGRVRGGASIGTWELAAARRRGRGRPPKRPLASAPIVKSATPVRPARSFYGVQLDEGH
jgi:hypothetical protein